MEDARNAIKEFTANHGHHNTTVHEHLKPAVTHEHVTPTRHENTTTAIDREVHQEHHHTSIQPIRHREVLPEEHQHNLVPVEHQEHRHGDPNVIKELLAQEAAQFKDVSETGSVQHTHEVLPVIHGEHIHHHVHEYIQPIVQKETIRPVIVHTTVPIHEVHHNEARHYAASALAAVSMADWTKNGGSLTGRDVRHEQFDGEPSAKIAEQRARDGHLHFHGIDGENYSPDSRPHHAGRDAALATAVGAEGAHHHHHQHRNSNERTNIDREAADVVAPTTPTKTRRAERHSFGSPMSDKTRSSMQSDSPSSVATDRTSMSSPRENKFADTHVGSTMDEKTASPATRDFAANDPAAVAAKKATLSKEQPADSKRKTSLLKRLNPLKDADGDGRKGIMS